MTMRIWTLKDGKFKHESDIDSEKIPEELDKIEEKYKTSGKIFVLTNGTLHLFDGTWKELKYREVVAVALLDYAERERYFQEEAKFLAEVMMDTE